MEKVEMKCASELAKGINGSVPFLEFNLFQATL